MLFVIDVPKLNKLLYYHILSYTIDCATGLYANCDTAPLVVSIEVPVSAPTTIGTLLQ